MLSEAFIRAIYADFQSHGVEAIAAARADDPLGYLKVVASLMPAKVEVRHGICDMTDEELQAVIRSDTQDGDEATDESGLPAPAAVH